MLKNNKSNYIQLPKSASIGCLCLLIVH